MMNPPMKRSTIDGNRPRGFTLIELMVVMLLISIVLAVAVPRFEGGVLQDPSKRMSRWMINTVRTLRSKAIQKQVAQGLVMDLDHQKMWIVREGMDETERTAASEKAFSLPGGFAIVDVQFPGKDPLTSGTVEVVFYPAGYSDHALVHLENDDAERMTYRIEPLLPKVKIYDQWIDF
jgi:prepilin-type N-terminal cleavage/methylation domain-containing protein